MGDGTEYTELDRAIEVIEEYGFVAWPKRRSPQDQADEALLSIDRQFTIMAEAIKSGAKFKQPECIYRYYARKLATALEVETDV
jgi:hypothetical protein